MTIRSKVVSTVILCVLLTIGTMAVASYVWFFQTIRKLLHYPVALPPELGVEFGLLVGGVTLGIGVLTGVIALIVGARLRRPVNELTDIVTAISKGNFTKEVSFQRHDELGRLADALESMKYLLNRVLTEVSGMALTVQEGNLGARGNPEAFSGDWRELIMQITTMIETFEKPFNITITALDRITKGDIPDRITEEYQGDFARMRQNVNALIDAMNEITWLAVMIAGGTLDVDAKERSEHDRLMKALNTLIHQLNGVSKEMNTIIHAVQEGNLSLRGNADPFSGGWRSLVVGMNAVMNAFVAPITLTTEHLERIAEGDIPAAITEEYKGDFNAIKHNLNMLIERMNGLLEEINGLILAVKEGRLHKRGNIERFVGDWRELIIGINHVIDAFVIPIMTTAAALDRIAKGDIPDRITQEYQGDFNEIKENLNMVIEATREVTKLAENMADGNLMIEVNERSVQDTLMRALNAMIQQLKQVVIGVKTASDNVASSSEELSSQAEVMSQGATHQATMSEQASASMEQMTANIRQNADNARQTEGIALQAAEYAEEGSKVVAETVMVMQQIAKKIAIIEEIAEQTRMLSLNATIEAVRAQDHGKAFSVVANEVRKLSDVTKQAAAEIDELASSSRSVSEKAAQMLTTIVPSIHKTAELVQEISAASSEQSMGAEQVNVAIQRLDQITQQNTLTSEQIAVMSVELSKQAEQLQHLIGFFKLEETSPESAISVNHETAKSPRPPQPQEDNHAANGRSSNRRATIPQQGDEQDAEFEKY